MVLPERLIAKTMSDRFIHIGATSVGWSLA
jgi:hypothetical protein